LGAEVKSIKNCKHNSINPFFIHLKLKVLL
jgi:hypothetical protein